MIHVNGVEDINSNIWKGFAWPPPFKNVLACQISSGPDNSHISLQGQRIMERQQWSGGLMIMGTKTAIGRGLGCVLLGQALRLISAPRLEGAPGHSCLCRGPATSEAVWSAWVRPWHPWTSLRFVFWPLPSCCLLYSMRPFWASIYYFFTFYLSLAALGIRSCAWLSLVAASKGYSLSCCAGFSLRWLPLLRSTGPRARGLQ